ncbi:type VI secretion system baseplate subunit TssF [Massilia sp. H6]|uniref:type VI secretion system baseplate subunit TssF n=1 Tax=Massilia sp. H6 TaxID=2970464 RepID=UPI0021695490|nr:type VI secretion system baseplate subunit TssF [Massilia sp. H6]UVW28000.1 type VI secretion system baseplate subunit TssF [Massilia sp. H6]
MDELFTKYERELVTLRSLCREYAQRYPKVAAQLQLGGETCDDPHVARLIQGVALLSARVAKRLDDSYPQFTEALLNLLFPHYLRPFPSCAIASVLGAPDGGEKPEAMPEMPRGTLLESAQLAGVSCTFRTVYDVKPSPVVLLDASFDTALCAPVATRLPEGVTATLSLKFASARDGEPLCAASASAMRLYADGDASFCAALRDALFMHTRAAYVQLDEKGPWERLPIVPVTPAGFADDDALIPFEARAHTAYRLLAEYFAFPEKFNFFDIDVPALLGHIPAGRTHFTLRLAIADIRPEGDKARMLASLSKQHLLSGCTPVVNLFSQPGVPVAYDQLSADYPVLAHGSHPHAYEVYSVDRVRMLRQNGAGRAVTEFRPFYSLRHGEESSMSKGHYWMMRHDETLAICSPGHEKSITLVNADCEPLAIERHFLSIDLTCTNRDLPCSLKIGVAGGDLFVPGTEQSSVIRLLRRPTRPVRLTNASGMQWRLISHLALNHHLLLLEGAEGLREMLALYDFAPSPVSRRQIAGIVTLEQSETTAWMRHKRGSSLIHGTEIRLTFDEEAYAGAGLQLFVQVLDQFFALYVQLNSFVELVILSRQSGKELFRCKPRSGRMALV